MLLIQNCSNLCIKTASECILLVCSTYTLHRIAWHCKYCIAILHGSLHWLLTILTIEEPLCNCNITQNRITLQYYHVCIALCDMPLHCNIRQNCIALEHYHGCIALCDTALHCNITQSATLAPHNVFVGQCEICSRAQCNCYHTCNAMQHSTVQSMDFSSFLFLQCNPMQHIAIQPNAMQHKTKCISYHILNALQQEATYSTHGSTTPPPNIFLSCFALQTNCILQFLGGIM